jgi:DNA helicase TIP49 (TBP-interacting protein)
MYDDNFNYVGEIIKKLEEIYEVKLIYEHVNYQFTTAASIQFNGFQFGMLTVIVFLQDMDDNYVFKTNKYTNGITKKNVIAGDVLVIDKSTDISATPHKSTKELVIYARVSKSNIRKSISALDITYSDEIIALDKGWIFCCW